MPKIRQVIKSIDLDQDGIFDEALSDAVHEEPHPVHYERAADVCGFDSVDVFPRFPSVAKLIAFVFSVRAAAGDDKAANAFLDRFTPKAARATANPQQAATAAPSASSNPEEKSAAESYRELLTH